MSLDLNVSLDRASPLSLAATMVQPRSAPKGKPSATKTWSLRPCVCSQAQLSDSPWRARQADGRGTHEAETGGARLRGGGKVIAIQ